MSNAEMGHMSEANFGPEVQPITPEMITLNQEGIVVVEPPQKPGFFKRVIKRGIPVVAGLALVFAACSGGDKNNDIKIDTLTPTPTAGAVLEPTSTIAPTSTLAPSNGGESGGKFPTPEPTRTATATSTPEVKQEIQCQILPAEDCVLKKITVDEGGEIGVVEYMFFMPEVGTPIYAPRDGYLNLGTEHGNPFSGQVAQLAWDNGGGGAVFRGGVDLGKLNRPVVAGEQIGTVSETGGVGKDAGFAFQQYKPSTGVKPTIDVDANIALFPSYLDIQSVSLDQVATGNPTSIPTFPK